MAKIQGAEGLRVAVWRSGYASENAMRRAPNVEFVPVDSASEFFESRDPLDGLITSAEVGYAWTLRYPQYSVINPLKRRIGVPLVYLIPGRDAVLREFIDNWLELRRGSGTIDRLYDHWILGKGAEKTEPRWSVLRNVLGWAD
jgi:ABC-type amino acid transport substrate-binding protein